MELNFLIWWNKAKTAKNVFILYSINPLCMESNKRPHTYLNNPVSFSCRKSEEIKGNLKPRLLLVDRSNCYAQVCVTGLFFADSFGRSSRVIFLSTYYLVYSSHKTFTRMYWYHLPLNQWDRLRMLLLIFFNFQSCISSQEQ